MSDDTVDFLDTRILIIEDEEAISSGCKMVLSDHGYDVDTMMTGRSGIEALQNVSYDLILLDMKLPDIDGMDVLRQIREDKSEAKIIIITGYASVQDAVSAMKLGAFDYLSKPFSDDELYLSVKKAIQNKKSSSHGRNHFTGRRKRNRKGAFRERDSHTLKSCDTTICGRRLQHLFFVST